MSKENTKLRAQTIGKNRPLIDAVRRLGKNTDKARLARICKVSWPTVKRNLEKLSISEDNNPLVIADSQDNYSLNAKYAYFVGISIGSYETRVAICDFSLNPLGEKEIENFRFKSIEGEGETNICRELIDLGAKFDKKTFYYRTDCTDAILKKINRVIRVLLECSCENEDFRLTGITISLPGIIDYKSGILVFCPNIKGLGGRYLSRILYDDLYDRLKDNNIILYFEHDTQVATLAEKEYLYHKEDKDNRKYYNKENIGCVYMSVGVGLGVIINRRLIRGNSEGTGQLGHILAPSLPKNLRQDFKFVYYDENGEKHEEDDIINKEVINEEDICTCGNPDCLEAKIRRDVFNVTSINDYRDKVTDKTLRTFREENQKRYDRLKYYMSFILNVSANLFNFDVIVFTGRLIENIPELQYSLDRLLFQSALTNTAGNCKIILSDNNSNESVSIGAAIASFNKCDFEPEPIEVNWVELLD